MININSVSNPEVVFRKIKRYAKLKNLKLISYGISQNKDKKYFVEISYRDKHKKIHFGNINYEDYTKHKNKLRRQSYQARASKITDKYGNYSYKNPFQANFWAYYCLW